MSHLPLIVNDIVICRDVNAATSIIKCRGIPEYARIAHPTLCFHDSDSLSEFRTKFDLCDQTVFSHIVESMESHLSRPVTSKSLWIHNSFEESQ